MATTPGGDSPTALARFGVLRGPGIGTEILVGLPVAVVGRGSQSDVRVDDDSVSDAHARLEYEAGRWTLTDLESTNGTFVESVRLAPHVPTLLSFGQSVRFGGVQLQFRPVEHADPEAARASYAPPPAQPRVAERARGFRLPLWVFLLVLILIALVVFFVIGSNVASGVEAVGGPVAAPLAALPGAAPGAP